MAEEKVCVNCRIFVEGTQCPICQSSNFSTNFKGVMYIIDANNSMIANNLEIKSKGKYAIRLG